MDFGLSEEQELLQRSAREFLTKECPTSLVRAVAADEEGLAAARWKARCRKTESPYSH